MKELLLLNTESIINTFDNSGVFKLTKPYDRQKHNFIPHCLAFFAKVPLVYHEPARMTSGKPKMVSMSKTLAALPKDDFGNKVKDLLWIFKFVPRGKLMSTNQGKHPEYSALTPIFMYAHKLYNNVCYSDWDRHDTRITAALGYFLEAAHAHSMYNKVAPQFDDINTLRKAKVYDKKYTDWPGRLVHVEGLDSTGEYEDGEDDTIEYGKEILIMTLQFWVANAAVRDTKANLLDIYQFGRVPKALDAIAPKASVNRGEEI